MGLELIAARAGETLNRTKIHRRRQSVSRGQPTVPLLRLLARDVRSPRRIIVVLRLRSILTQVAALGRQWAPGPAGAVRQLHRAEPGRARAGRGGRARPRGGREQAAGAARGGRLAAGRARQADRRRRPASSASGWCAPGGWPPGCTGPALGRGAARRRRGLAGRRRRRHRQDGHRLRVPVKPRPARRRALAARRRLPGLAGRRGRGAQDEGGQATARPGDWVVEAPTGERWPVSDEQFRRSYRPRHGPSRHRRPGKRAPRRSAAARRRRSPSRACSSRRGPTSCPGSRTCRPRRR